MMQVSSTNDGPVTVLVDSKNRDDVTPEPATLSPLPPAPAAAAAVVHAGACDSPLA
jgi:hypothetical protein